MRSENWSIFSNRKIKLDKAILLIPSTEEGNGTGHMKRMISLAEKWKGAVEIYIKTEHLDRILPTFPQKMRELIVSTIKKPHDYSRIILDQRETDREFFKAYLSGGPVIAVDEGGALRSEIPYLIDILPLPKRFGAPNFKSLSLLDLPEKVNETERNGKILITFGGEDPNGLTEKLCNHISEKRRDLISKITVILGSQYKGAEPPEDFEVMRNLPSLKKIIPSYSGIICSYGLTAYEASFLSVPMLIANPSDYHEELTKIARFHSAQVATTDLKEVIAFIEKPENFPVIRPDFEGPSLLEIIEQIDFSGTRCPVCGSTDFSSSARFEHKSYYQCDNCSMFFMINVKERKMTYGEEYFFEQYEQQYGKTYLDDFDHLSKLADDRLKIIRKMDPQGKNVLDSGCAYGPFLKKASDQGYEPYGTDISSDAVLFVKNKLSFPAVSGPFEDFSIPADWRLSHFDLLTMWYVIEHFPDLAPVLRKVNSLLKTGGLFAFSTPSGSGVSAKNDLVDFLRKSPDDHYTVWEPSKSSSVLERFGFVIEKIRITGHHPERFQSPLAKFKSGRQLLSLCSRVMGLGDTYEIYARKVRNL